MVRSLVFAFPVVPRNYTWFDTANNLDPALERPLISLSEPSAKSPTHLGARRGLCVLTIRSRSYRIPLLVSACYPYQLGFVRVFQRFPVQQPLEICEELLSFVAVQTGIDGGRYLSEPQLRTRIRRGLLKVEQLHALARRTSTTAAAAGSTLASSTSR